MATASLRSLTLLFSAGWGGSWVYNNTDTARDVIATQLARLLKNAAAVKNAERSDGRGGGSGSNATSGADMGALNELSEKVSKLAQDVSRTADRPVVVLGPGSSRVSALADALSLAGWAVLAVGCGSACYYVAIWKGWSLRDLAWVSQASFDNTVSALQGGIAKVTGAVAAVRREFGERMRVIESRVDAVRNALSMQIESEVSEVKAGIADVQADVASVHTALADVTDRIDAMDGKLDTATKGIMALVRVVSSLTPDAGRPGNPFWELKQLANGNGPNGSSNKTPLLTSATTGTTDTTLKAGMHRRLSHGFGDILQPANGIKTKHDANLAVPVAQTSPRLQ